MLLYIFVFLLGLYNSQVVEVITTNFKTVENTYDTDDIYIESDSESSTYPEIDTKQEEDLDSKTKILNFFKNLK